MKIFILLLAINNFIMGRHVSRKRGPQQIFLHCDRDCFWSFHTNQCVARGRTLCSNYNMLDCQVHRAVCKFRMGACVIKASKCANTCHQAAVNSPDCA